VDAALDSLYQEIILDHYKHPHHAGLRDPFEAEVHHVNPTCGDEVTLRVHLADGVVADCGIGLTAVGADHFACGAAEDHLRGKPATAEHLAAAGQICHDAVDPSADQRGPVDYKRHLARELVTRALTRSTARAGGANA